MSTSDKAEDSLTQVEEIAEENALCGICENHLYTSYIPMFSRSLVLRALRLRVDTCPTCRGTIPRGGVRNRFAEMILGACTIRCTEPGCGKSFPFSSWVHYETCEYRRVVCPRDYCGWSGTIGDICSHRRMSYRRNLYGYRHVTTTLGILTVF